MIPARVCFRATSGRFLRAASHTMRMITATTAITARIKITAIISLWSYKPINAWAAAVAAMAPSAAAVTTWRSCLRRTSPAA